MAAHNVVIVGGAYGGLAAALSLLRLVDESAATANPEALLQPLARLDRGLVITVIDERDGLCMLFLVVRVVMSLIHRPHGWFPISDGIKVICSPSLENLSRLAGAAKA